MIRTRYILPMLLVASACASSPDTATQSAIAELNAAKYQVKNDAPRIAELRNKNLDPGQCGMLLWTLDKGEPVMVFRNVEGRQAEMIIDGSPARLELVEEQGERRYGASTEQSYTLEAGTPGETRVKVSASFGTPFEGGVYVEQGVITLRNFFGWERVTPVAGLAGCRA
ncbi:hypothetical protein FF098_014255 [Parvularcula flava]|uniref:Lipoprotein n=1 Tax=Aquisalinus luteolus TaxID=1566827 RepID=A0A8J3A9K4_9PROT|nr:hypothetical protein [Aquisalinus luteolus]NHK29082.1 hypothetical protein [Aquisalinus luteolus]GGI00367.1 hypothetical protein GCM10011355_28490 [Aquisalinus luteolus]